MRLGMSVPSYVELDVVKLLRPILVPYSHTIDTCGARLTTRTSPRTRSGPAQTQGRAPPECRRRTAAAHPSDQAPYTAGKKAFVEATLALASPPEA
jgi:hypothetical protein